MLTNMISVEHEDCEPFMHDRMINNVAYMYKIWLIWKNS